MPQQTYSAELTKYMKGRRGNMESWNTISRTNESATAIGFGAAVFRGAGEHGCVPAAGGDFLGVSEANQVLPHLGDEYRQYDTVAICERGVIGVDCSGAVKAGDAAAWDAAAKKWKVASSGSPQTAGCEFDTDGTDTVVLLRVRRPVAA